MTISEVCQVSARIIDAGKVGVVARRAGRVRVRWIKQGRVRGTELSQSDLVSGFTRNKMQCRFRAGKE